ncbi:hypothetical protein [Arthrobacter sp. MYb213]|uniref:hypothetical protein n=1 Tax=Arthrobacter sp. MYb213 TaxID=1848595 RepID=UPI000CFA8ACF|nr:hypothetical protein [Arthrobacter sp. MYb213]PRB72780.1 hypothetical protein CQ011_03915 [Arthrobacter sp. MYb213]
MNLLDTISIIGEIIAWVGLSLGLLCFLLAKQYKRKKASAVYLDAFVFSEGNVTSVRWMAPDGMHERPLTHTERRVMEHGWQTVLVDIKTYRRLMRRDPQEPLEIFSMLAKFLLGAGVLGFALSWLSIFD